MATLKVTIDARAARAGAEAFIQATHSMTSAARSFEQSSKGVASALDNLKKQQEQAKQSTFSLRDALAGLAGASLAKNVVSTIASFEQLKTSLRGVTGSTAAADAEFEKLKKFAKETPFSVEQATKAFLRMNSAGLTPSMENLRAFGDIASSLPGKSITDFVESVADATLGEGERLKEFGIKLTKMGDQVKLSMGDTSLTVKNSAKDIEAALVKIASSRFGGAMERQAQTLAGTWAALQDGAAGLAVEIGDGGLTAALKEAVAVLSDTTSGGTSAARALGETLGIAVRHLTSGFKFLAEHTTGAKVALGAFVALRVDGYFAAMTVGMNASTGAAVGLRAAMMGLATAAPIAAGALLAAGLVKYSGGISKTINEWGLGDDEEAINRAQRDQERADQNALIAKLSDQEKATFNKWAMGGVEVAASYTKAWLQSIEAQQEATKYSETLSDALAKQAGRAHDTRDAIQKLREAQLEASGTSKTFRTAMSGLAGEVLKGQGMKRATPGTGEDEGSGFKQIKEDSYETLETWLEIPRAIREAQMALEHLNGKTVARGLSPMSDAAMWDTLNTRQKGKDGKPLPDPRGSGDVMRELMNDMGTTGADSSRDYFPEPPESYADFLKTLERTTEEKQRLIEVSRQGVDAMQLEASFQETINGFREKGVELTTVETSALYEKLTAQQRLNKELEKAQRKTTEKNPFTSWIDSMSDAQKQMESFQNLAVQGFRGLSQEMASALVDGKANFREFFVDVGRQMTAMIIEMGIATTLKGLITSNPAMIAKGLGVAGIGIGAGLATRGAKEFHQGGIVGQGGASRMVDPSWFHNAPRYHGGGIAGLRPNEIPAILERGEEVIPRGGRREGGQVVEKNLHITFNVSGVQDIRGFRRGTRGELERLGRLLGMRNSDLDF